MGTINVDEKLVSTPDARVKVSQLKELAGIPPADKLYDAADGQLLDDEEIIPADGRRTGHTTDWQRGS